MNVTELARKLKISPKKLREIMPQLGFDVGEKAIKVDPKTAQAIIEKLSNSANREKYLGEKPVMERKKKIIIKGEEGEDRGLKKISIPEKIVVKDLARKMELPVANLMMELMKNGVMASLNQHIDYDTASIIAEDLGFESEREGAGSGDSVESVDYEDVLAVDKNTAVERPPVIVVMGHVDHGKTKLLDTIRETNIVEGEAGGITQHIGAYQVSKSGRLLTFIDTPGHEAFSAMRSRGAQVADIAILLVAADDSVQPQTMEAVAHIKNSGLPFVVAINKIDKPGANLDKVKSDLAQIGLTPEDWGGDTICVPVSAKQGTNIDDLLETLFVVADMEKDSIIANKNVPAIGTIIESHVDKGEGPVATVLIQTGSLRINDFVEINGIPGKIKMMRTWKDEVVKEALASMPVRILGMKDVPQVGDILKVIKDKKEIKKITRNKDAKKIKLIETEDVVRNNDDDEDGDVGSVNLVLKSDVFGSIEAIVESLEKIKVEGVRVNILKQGLGNITEKDVDHAKETDAYLIGFNVKATNDANKNAIDKGVDIHLFSVIYDLLELVEKRAREVAGTQIVRTKTGEVKVLEIFRTNKKGQIVGCKVLDGKVRSDYVAVVKDGENELGEIKIANLQSGKEEVAEVVEGQEFGMQSEGGHIIEKGNILEVYMEEEMAVG